MNQETRLRQNIAASERIKARLLAKGGDENIAEAKREQIQIDHLTVLLEKVITEKLKQEQQRSIKKK